MRITYNMKRLFSFVKSTLGPTRVVPMRSSIVYISNQPSLPLLTISYSIDFARTGLSMRLALLEGDIFDIVANGRLGPPVAQGPEFGFGSIVELAFVEPRATVATGRVRRSPARDDRPGEHFHRLRDDDAQNRQVRGHDAQGQFRYRVSECGGGSVCVLISRLGAC